MTTPLMARLCLAGDSRPPGSKESVNFEGKGPDMSLGKKSVRRVVRKNVKRGGKRCFFFAWNGKSFLINLRGHFQLCVLCGSSGKF